jgi:hypothetical protein
MAEPKNPLLPKLRDWPMFQISRPQRSRRAKASGFDGRPLPRIADLVVAHVPGSPVEKLAWLRQQSAEGNLDGDDPEEIAQAEALLAILVRLAGGRGERQKRRLDDLLDEGLQQTFPASDPVSVGHFTGTEVLTHPVGAPRGGGNVRRE